MATKPRRILLADDNDANRLISKTILERSGHAVTTAKNGSHALNLAHLAIFDLILLDIMMPVIDGVRTLRRLRRKKGPNQKTPVFAFTAFCGPQDKQNYLLSGFDYVLSKPLKLGDIERAIDNYISQGAISSSSWTEDVPLEDIPLLQMDTIKDLIDIGDFEKLEDIKSHFWSSVQEQCLAIKEGLPQALSGSETHLSQFRRAVHAIKGACALIGLSRVEHICRKLQNAPLEATPSLIKYFLESLSESRPVLDEALSRPRQLDAAVKVSG